MSPINTTEDGDVTNSEQNADEYNFYVDPVPDWARLDRDIGNGFAVLSYGVGCTFIAHACVCLTFIPIFRWKLLKQIALMCAIVGLFTSGTCLGLFLLVDPFSKRRILPVLMTHILAQAYKPGLILAYICIQNALNYIGKVVVRRNKLHTTTRALLATFSYLLVIVIVKTVIYVKKVKHLLVIPEVIFLMFSSYLCVCYVCSGFKLINIIEENKAFERDHFDSGKSYHCSKRKSSEKGEHNANIIDDALSKSNMDNTNSKKYRKRITRLRKTFGDSSDSSDINIKGKESDKIHDIEGNAKPKDSMEDLNLKPDVTCSSFLEYPEAKKHPTDDSSLEADDIINQQIVENKWFLGSSIELEKQTQLSADCENLVNPKTQSADVYESDSDCYANEHTERSILETGYLGDVETELNRTFDNESPDNISLITTFIGKDMSTAQSPSAFKTNSTISLLRLHQGDVLHRVVQLTYCVTFLFIVNVIFQLYSLFGVYGIFGSGKVPDPWPWFMFQLLHRLVELSLVVSLSASVCMILKNKASRRRKKHRKHRTKQCRLKYDSQTED